MNIEKTVRAALFSEPKKVELSTEKVELSSVKELNQYISILKKNAQESEKEGELYIKAESDLQRAWQRLNQHRNAIYTNAFSSAPKIIEMFEAKAKELGVSASSIPEVKELEKEIQNIKEYVKFFDGVKRPNSQL